MIALVTTGHSPDNQGALESVIEAGRPPGSSTYGPGAYLYWFLAHHVSAKDVLFADLLADRDRTTGDSRTGRIFLITSSAVILVAYQNAAAERTGDPQQDFGTATVTFHAKTDDAVRSVTWSNRSLYIAHGQDTLPGRSKTAALERESISVVGREWTVKLPSERFYGDVDKYFAELRCALYV